MWYKNVAGKFFGLVAKHACDRRTDGQTDRITTAKTALAQLRRAVKMKLEKQLRHSVEESLGLCCLWVLTLCWLYSSMAAICSQPNAI